VSFTSCPSSPSHCHLCGKSPPTSNRTRAAGCPTSRAKFTSGHAARFKPHPEAASGSRPDPRRRPPRNISSLTSHSLRRVTHFSNLQLLARHSQPARSQCPKPSSSSTSKTMTSPAGPTRDFFDPPAPSPRRGGRGRGDEAGTRLPLRARVPRASPLPSPPPQGEGTGGCEI
jgi:hypothetical protein